MLIRIFDKEVLRRKNQNSAPVPKMHRVGLFKCDQCGTEYEVDDRLNYVLSKAHHFCTRKCQGLARRSGGCLNYIYDMAWIAEDRPETVEKIKQTKLEKYGPLGSDARKEIAAKSLQTKFKLYGGNTWDSPILRGKLDYPEMARKRHETMKASGAYKTSKEEDEFFEFLQQFGRVERGVVVNKVWPIDFYLPDKEVYVQFDGVYWHGLDRPLKVIAEHRTARDVVIHKKWQTDREQERWFREAGKTLIRVPSTSFDRKSRTCPTLTF